MFLGDLQLVDYRVMERGILEKQKACNCEPFLWNKVKNR